jgi:hypothetical protein
MYCVYVYYTVCVLCTIPCCTVYYTVCVLCTASQCKEIDRGTVYNTIQHYTAT